jgi:hypothetical protein
MEDSYLDASPFCMPMPRQVLKAFSYQRNLQWEEAAAGEPQQLQPALKPTKAARFENSGFPFAQEGLGQGEQQDHGRRTEHQRLYPPHRAEPAAHLREPLKAEDSKVKQLIEGLLPSIQASTQAVASALTALATFQPGAAGSAAAGLVKYSVKGSIAEFYCVKGAMTFRKFCTECGGFPAGQQRCMPGSQGYGVPS